MGIEVTHSAVSPAAPSPYPGRIGGPDWNAELVVVLSGALKAVNDLTAANDRFLYFTGPDSAAAASITAAARSLLALADLASMLAALGGAPLNSPTFTGTPAAPTAVPGTNTTQIANAAFVKAAIDAAVAALINSAPGTLDTLNELAAAIGDDVAFSTTVTTLIGTKAALTRLINTSGLAGGGGDLSSDRTIDVPKASQAEAEAGTIGTKAMTPLTTRQAIAAQLPGGRAQVRQAVLAGATDSAGAANFLSAGSGLAVNLAATAVPICIAFAAGYGASGAIDYIGQIVADATSAWSGLTASSTLFLYVDRDPTTGALTYGFTAIEPIYQSGGSASTTSGQHTFLIDKMAMSAGNGSSAAVVQRVFLGECTTNGSAVTAIITYALRGEFIGPWVAPLPGNNATVSASHNIGVTLFNGMIELKNLTSEQGYGVGDLVEWPATRSSFDYTISPLKRRTTMFLLTSAVAFILTSVSSNAEFSPTAANWAYRMRGKRAF